MGSKRKRDEASPVRKRATQSTNITTSVKLTELKAIIEDGLKNHTMKMAARQYLSNTSERLIKYGKKLVKRPGGGMITRNQLSAIRLNKLMSEMVEGPNGVMITRNQRNAIRLNELMSEMIEGPDGTVITRNQLNGKRLNKLMSEMIEDPGGEMVKRRTIAGLRRCSIPNARRKSSNAFEYSFNFIRVPPRLS
ncbi:unnamed protein product [Rotaria sp. Silwood1]|nr:unnamed protein product [Rotaria sp. Silwood1]